MLKLALILGIPVAVFGWIHVIPAIRTDQYIGPYTLPFLVIVTVFIAIPGVLSILSFFFKKK